MFDTFTAIVNFASDIFSGGGDSREKAIEKGAKPDLDLVEKYGGFLSGVGEAARAAMGQTEGAYAPFEMEEYSLEAPRIQKGSARAAQAPALGGIQSSRLNLAVQTAMRRKTQSNADFQRLLSQQMTSPRPVRGKRTMGIEPARLPSVQEIKPAEVRKGSK